VTYSAVSLDEETMDCHSPRKNLSKEMTIEEAGLHEGERRRDTSRAREGVNDGRVRRIGVRDGSDMVCERRRC